MRNSLLRARFGVLALVLLAAWPRLAHPQTVGRYDGRTVESKVDSAPPYRSAVLPSDDSLPSYRPSVLPSDVRWYHLSAGLAVVGLATLADEGLRDQIQAHRTSGGDDVAKVFKRMGQAEVFGTVGLGTIAVGIISGNPRIRRAGERISAGLLAAAFMTVGLKEVVGRHRPSNPTNAFQFTPISGHDSWPSGHTTMAFALAAGVSDEVHSLPVTIGLYSAATMTAWSRVNDDRHWLSDVLTGALIGVTGAKLMNGHWRVLGIHGPRFLLEPGAVGVSLKF